MFDQFRSAYQVDPREPGADTHLWRPRGSDRINGFDQFAEEFTGASFNGGLYRFHDEHSAALAATFINQTFPQYSERTLPFGYDWLGRHFLCDFRRVVHNEPQVLLIDPGAGEALEVPVNFTEFHDVELVVESDAAVASSFHREWLSSQPSAVTPILRSQCAGYDVPLFLGGSDTADNLSLTDLEVYRDLSSQLWRMANAHDSSN